MRKFNILLLACIIFLLVPIIAIAQNEAIQIKIDGETITTDSPPLIISNRVLVPVRVISESLGYNVLWDSKTREVYLTKNDNNIKFNIDQPYIWNSGQKILLDVAPTIEGGRVYLPIRAFSESIGSLVDWDGKNRIVYVLTKSLKNSNSIINEENSAKLEAITQEGTSFTLSIFGDELWEPNFNRLSSPERLVIDLNKMVLGEELKELSKLEISDNQLIAGIRYSQYDINPNKVRVVIDLKEKAGYSYQLDNNSLKVNIAPKTFMVVIDAGHGGRDPGAIGYSGLREKDFNFSVAFKVNQLLKDDPNIEPVLTRSSDIYMSLDERVDFANNLGADLFISIHANAVPNKSTVSGIETYYYHSNSSVLANMIHSNLIKNTGLIDRGIRTAGFRVIKYTQMPAVLIEAGYLTNKVDEKAIATESYRQQVAFSITEAIKEYFK